MDAFVGIEQIFNSCLSFFYTIYYGGVALFNWFCTPISYTDDEFINVLISSFVGYTPFEISFGVALVSVLFMAVLKFVKDFAGM